MHSLLVLTQTMAIVCVPGEGLESMKGSMPLFSVCSLPLMPRGLACSVWIIGGPGLAHRKTTSLGEQPSPLVGGLAGCTDTQALWYLLTTKWERNGFCENCISTVESVDFSDFPFG